jgi:ankyrin repeat protein
MYAAKLNDIEKSRELISKNRFLLYDFDHALLTPLHWACKRGYFQLAKIFIQHGADPNCYDIIGRTPLFLAVTYQYVEII